MMRTVALFIFGTLLARLFDLNGEVNRVRKKHNRAIIAADVRRFGHVINKDGVLGTHTHRVTPAMAAGLTDKLMDMTEVARLIDDAQMRVTIQQRAAMLSLPQSN